MLTGIAERAAKLDEAAYLNMYQDVAEAVRQGAFPTGLGHFLARPDEQRRGFALSARLATLLGDTGGLLGGPGQLLTLAEAAARRMRRVDIPNQTAQLRREAA